jgi:hypothetical protein
MADDGAELLRGRRKVVNADYRGTLLILCMACQVVPTAMAVAPGAMSRSKLARVVIHLGSVGLGVAAFVYAPNGPLQNAVFAVSLMALMEYRSFVLLEQAFERRHQRAPRVSGLIRRFDMAWEDRWMSLACFGLGLAAMFIVIEVARAA